MSNNFMDGIPVKIAEKYKPLPKISLPQVINQRLNNTQSVLSAGQDYDFNLERNVLGRINEWKELRQREQFDRQARTRLREDERNRLVEENKKKILAGVSYPNAEDLSSSSDDDDTATTLATTNKLDNQNCSGLPGHFSPLNNFNTILEPTIIRAMNTTNYSNCLDATSPSSNHHSIGNNLKYVNKINYSDFENVTSSPFDNMELKSINDLAILAQVLNNSINLNENAMNSTGITATTESIVLNEENENISNLNDSKIMPVTLQTNPITTTEANCNTMYGISNYPLYSQLPQGQNYQHFIIGTNYPNQQQQQQQQQQITYVPTINYNDQHSNVTQTPQPHKVVTDYGPYNNLEISNYYNRISTYNHNTITNQLQVEDDDIGSSNSKSKSKSVPDIMKELNDELKDLDEKRRIRNNSQTIPSSHSSNTENDKKHTTTVNNKNNQNLEYDENYKALTSHQQILIRNICLMGFPLKRVIRVSKLFGSDEKKIIDHLICLNDLIDLGFDEIKISEALIKSDNNKDKALDFLIS